MPAPVLPAALKLAPIFAAVRDDSLRRLVGRCVTRRLAPGEALFEAGESADRFFAVLQGSVKVFKISSGGGEQILHLYGPGRTIGEAAMWAGGAFPAFASALEDTAVLVIPRTALRQAISEDPDLVMGMLAGLSAKLHELVRLVGELSLKEVPARLAGALLQECRRAASPTFTLKQSKKELAAQLGTIPETLSRAFAKLKSSGAIEVHGPKIVVRDASRLQKLADS